MSESGFLLRLFTLCWLLRLFEGVLPLDDTEKGISGHLNDRSHLSELKRTLDSFQSDSYLVDLRKLFESVHVVQTAVALEINGHANPEVFADAHVTDGDLSVLHVLTA